MARCWHAGFERLHRLLGSSWTARTGLLLFAATAMTSVLPSLFAQHSVWVQVCLFSAMAINALADTNGYVACALLVSCGPGFGACTQSAMCMSSCAGSYEVPLAVRYHVCQVGHQLEVVI